MGERANPCPKVCQIYNIDVGLYLNLLPFLYSVFDVINVDTVFAFVDDKYSALPAENFGMYSGERIPFDGNCGLAGVPAHQIEPREQGETLGVIISQFDLYFSHLLILCHESQMLGIIKLLKSISQLMAPKELIICHSLPPASHTQHNYCSFLGMPTRNKGKQKQVESLHPPQSTL